MTKMKRIGALLLALCMVFALCFVVGCDKGGNDDKDNSNSNGGNGGNTPITLTQMVANYVSHGYEVDVANAEDLVEFAEEIAEMFEIEVTLVGAFEAYIEISDDENDGAEVYEFASKAEAELFWEKVQSMYAEYNAVHKFDGCILFIASSQTAIDKAYTQGNATPGNGNTGATPVDITMNTIIANLQSNGLYTQTEELDETSEELFDEFGVNVTVLANAMGYDDDNMVIAYELASEEQVQALADAFSASEYAAAMECITNGKFILMATSAEAMEFAFVKGDFEGTPQKPGGDVVVVSKYSIVVIDTMGNPIVDALVQYCAKDSTCYTGYTDNNGMICDDKIDTNFYVAMVYAEGYEMFQGQIFFTEEIPQICIKLIAVEK